MTSHTLSHFLQDKTLYKYFALSSYVLLQSNIKYNVWRILNEGFHFLTLSVSGPAKCHKVHLLLVFLLYLQKKSVLIILQMRIIFMIFDTPARLFIIKKWRRQVRRWPGYRVRSVRIVDIREGRGKRNNWLTFAEEWGQNWAREEELSILHLHSAP